MRDKTLLSHAAVAAVAVLAAGFAAWGPELQDDDDTDVVVLAGKGQDLRSVAWHDDRYDVLVRRGTADRLQVEVVTRPPKPGEPPKGKPGPEGESEGDLEGDDDDTGTPAAPAPAAPTPVAAPAGPSKVYPGSSQAQELFDAMAPLMAPRSLGSIEAAKLGPMGLDQPAEKLVVELASGSQSVAIGDAVYGSGDRYARVDSGEVFLLPAKTLSGLRSGGSGLIERRTLPVENAKVQRAEITAGANGREVIQRFAEEKDKAFFADPAVPDDKLEQLGNWMDRVLKLRIVDFAEAPAAGPPAVTVALFGGEAPLGTLSLWPAGDKIAVATSTYFGGPVTISKANAEAVLRDLEAVLSEGR